MLLNCHVGRLLRVPWTARRSNQSVLKEISPDYSLEDWCWSWNSNPLAAWWEEVSHWQRPWCWEILRARGEGDERGWDGWMASPAQWTWVWASSGSWCWTGKPDVLQSMVSQRVRHAWETELKKLPQYIKKLKLPYKPAIMPPYKTYIKEFKSHDGKDTCPPMFIAALFTITKISIYLSYMCCCG